MVDERVFPQATPPLRIKFHHGLGDTLMFRSVLSLLGSPVQLFLHPDLGQRAIFHGHPGIDVVDHPDPGATYKDVVFAMENSRPCIGGPPTKARVCMEHEFGLIRPDFRIRPLPLENLQSLRSPILDQTEQFLAGMGRYVVCHFQGTWGPAVQNPSEDFARRTVQALLQRGYGVVLINYDYIFHNPTNPDLGFADGDRVRSTYRVLPMEFESLWHILNGAAMFIGVDSGPLHAAVCLDVPSVYLRKDTNFLRDFYDEGLERLVVVDVRSADAVPGAVLDSISGACTPPRIEVQGTSAVARSSRAQAEFVYALYERYSNEMIKNGTLHDAGRIGRRGMVYRTDAEVLYALVRTWRPDLVMDFCTGLGDALSYILHALASNGHGLCVSADRENRLATVAWLRSVDTPMDRLLLCDQRDIRDLFPVIEPVFRHKDRLMWVLDTNHEFEMGQWQLQRIVKPFRHKSIFAKDDVVAVNGRLESDMGAIYAMRDYVSRHMEVVSTNAAFGAVSGLPCAEMPHRGAEGRATPGAIPFRPCRRNTAVQDRIRSLYPRWDGDANKMVFFWSPDVLKWRSIASPDEPTSGGTDE